MSSTPSSASSGGATPAGGAATGAAAETSVGTAGYSADPRAIGFRVPRARNVELHASLRAQLDEAVARVVYGTNAAGDAEIRAFESEFAAAVGQAEAVGSCSGTAALFLAVRACGIGSGDEVITIANSDISTTAAIRNAGAEAVLCDIQASDYTIDAALVRYLITPRTKAILPVDLYGHPADVRALRAIANEHNLLIIEDACLATGAHDSGKPVGAFADVTVFSFAPFKPLGSVGNAGICVTSNPDLASELRKLASYGRDPRKPWPKDGSQRYDAEGYHLPMDPVQAAVLRVKLPHLAAWTAGRRAVAAAYEAGLRASSVRGRLSWPVFREESAPTFRQYTIQVDDRDAVHRKLRDAGIEAVLHYVPGSHRHPAYASRPLPGCEDVPVTERVSQRLLCLPLWPNHTQEEIEYVLQEIEDALH
ncbi:MAG: DegT/DnrJ/EryC1/StrS family aminotransferase [Armatimonadetes bacterium]|nr:DegT/DnrJ/EryC1/StrS family aminotransferase [Armatimonadota bacterium]